MDSEYRSSGGSMDFTMPSIRNGKNRIADMVPMGSLSCYKFTHSANTPNRAFELGILSVDGIVMTQRKPHGHAAN